MGWEVCRYCRNPVQFCDCHRLFGSAGLSLSQNMQAFQAAVGKWVVEAFGEEVASDSIERNHRFLEEALETVQANHCTREEAHRLVDYVFDRPIGDLPQEIGGALVTLAALCQALEVDMQTAAVYELSRVILKIDAIRAKRAAKADREKELKEVSPLP
jgi:hypothetical protein